MKRRCLKNGGRERAFWGAVIPAVASLIGTGLSISAQSRNQKEALEEQKRLQEENLRREQTENAARSINNYFASGDDYEDEYEFKRGGRRKLRNAGKFVMTDGGPMINLSTGEQINPGQVIPPGTYRTLGVKHNQTNPQGKEGTGIIAPDGKPFEVEKGETQVVTNNEDIIFSDRLKKNGVSFSDIAATGVNPYALEREQAKQRRHLRDGRSTPVGRSKALWGATFTTPDYIGLGTNIAGSLLSGIWGNSAYNDLIDSVNYDIPDYVDEMYVAGPTRWRNAAQRAEVRRNQLIGRRSIARNTASSAVGLDRMQKLDTDAMYELNKLWDEKANKETEMRQANAERRQQVLARNATNKNAYLQKVAEIKNQQLATKLGLQQSKLNNNVAMIQGIGSSIGGFLQSGIDNYQADQARRMQLAASPYGTAERMAAMGVDFSRPLMRSLSSEAETRVNRFANDNSESGVKSYNDALDSYNYWNNRLGLTGDSYKRRSLGNVGVNTVPSMIARPTNLQSSNRRWNWAAGDWR